MSWECHASRHVPKPALKSDIFRTSLRLQNLCLIWGTLYGEHYMGISAGKNLVKKGWQIVGKNVSPASPKRQPIVSPTLAKCWHNVTPMFA